MAEHNQLNEDKLQVSHENQGNNTENHYSNGKPIVASGESVKLCDFDTISSNLRDLQETEPKIFDNNETRNLDALNDMDVQDLTNDFGNTFMLDEEIELEQKMIKKSELSSSGRYFTVLFYRIDI